MPVRVISHLESQDNARLELQAITAAIIRAVNIHQSWTTTLNSISSEFANIDEAITESYYVDQLRPLIAITNQQRAVLIHFQGRNFSLSVSDGFLVIESPVELEREEHGGNGSRSINAPVYFFAGHDIQKKVIASFELRS